jgi:hypothetical protein
MHNGGPSRTRDVNGTIQKSTLDWIISTEDITAVESRKLEGISDPPPALLETGQFSYGRGCGSICSQEKSGKGGQYPAALRRALTEVK